jgi:ABC-2 type transport system permease protein
MDNPKTLKNTINRIIAQIRKEIKIIRNDRLAMFFLFVIPLTATLIIQFGVGSDAKPIGGGDLRTNRASIPNIAIIDRDYSDGYPNYDLSVELVNQFFDYQKQGECKVFTATNQSEIELLLGQGKISGYIIIPNGFEFNVSIRFVSMLTVIFDSLELMDMNDLRSLVSDVLTEFRYNFNLTGAIHLDVNVINVSIKAPWLFQLMPIFFPIIIFSMTSLVSSQSVIGDIPKDRLILTPVNKKEIILGKLFGSIIIISLMVAMLWGLSLGFGMQIRSSAWNYYMILWIIALTGAATGIFISTIARTTLAAFQFFIFFFISQVILTFFITDEILLGFFPLYSGMRLLQEVIQQGEPLLNPSNGIFPLFFILWVEFFFYLFASYGVYKAKRSLI